MNAKAQNFIGRLSPNADPQIREKIETAFRLVDRFGDKIVAVKSDRRYSVDGHAEAIKAALDGSFGDHMAQLRKSAADKLADLEATIARMSSFSIDPENVVAEMQRAEVRGWLRGKPPAEVARIALETDETVIKSAVITVPAMLSGIPDQARDALIDREIRAVHGSRYEAVVAAKADWETAAAAISLADDDMRRAARNAGVKEDRKQYAVA